MNQYTTFSINDHIYQIKDPMGVLMTLVIGKTHALLVDTGYGLGDIKSYISQITHLPLIVVASHGHMDHTGGNYLFSQVYIHPLDMDLCKLHNSPAWRHHVYDNACAMHLVDDTFDVDTFIEQKEGHLLPLSNNQIFDLGDIHAKVIPMEGHTKGSIGILLEEDEILIVTDATCPFVWLFLPESTSVTTYIQMLTRTLKLPFQHILLGHGKGIALPRSKVEDFLYTAKTIDLKKAVKVTFHNFELENSYCYTLGKMYDQNDVGIVFDPHKLE